MMDQPKPPQKEFRAGPVRAAIWKEERSEFGRAIARFSVKIEKRYFDESTKDWRTTDYFFANDLPRLRLVAEKAFEFVALRESEDDPEFPTVAR